MPGAATGVGAEVEVLCFINTTPTFTTRLISTTEPTTTAITHGVPDPTETGRMDLTLMTGTGLYLTAINPMEVATAITV
jgi:hypothetical protein